MRVKCTLVSWFPFLNPLHLVVVSYKLPVRLISSHVRSSLEFEQCWMTTARAGGTTRLLETVHEANQIYIS